MSDNIVSYSNPPVVETVLDLQFEPIKDFNEVHIGIYWEKFLKKQWPHIEKSIALDPQIEEFNGKGIWQKLMSQPRFNIQADAPDIRFQFADSSSEKILQIQNSRFILNWRHTDQAYPRFKNLLPDYIAFLNSFYDFVETYKKQQLVYNQWEVTYVNQIPKGKGLWETLSDWPNIINNFHPIASVDGVTSIESYSAGSIFLIGNNEGRLRVQVSHNKRQHDDETTEEILQITLTAKGTIQNREHIERCLCLGRKTVVKTFDSMLTDSAKVYFGRDSNGR